MDWWSDKRPITASSELFFCRNGELTPAIEPISGEVEMPYTRSSVLRNARTDTRAD